MWLSGSHYRFTTHLCNCKCAERHKFYKEREIILSVVSTVWAAKLIIAFALSCSLVEPVQIASGFCGGDVLQIVAFYKEKKKNCWLGGRIFFNIFVGKVVETPLSAPMEWNSMTSPTPLVMGSAREWLIIGLCCLVSLAVCYSISAAPAYGSCSVSKGIDILSSAPSSVHSEFRQW